MHVLAVGLIHSVAVMSVLGGFAAPVAAAQVAAAPPDPVRAAPVRDTDALLDFDIPAQPLDAALGRYAQITGRPALAPSDLLGGRVSSAVQGRYSAEMGLQILLQGTGLTAARRSSRLGQTFVLQKAEATTAVPRDGLAALFGEEGYAGLVQARVWQSLCADARTRPGDYSSLLQFELGMDGRLVNPRLLGSSGNARRDAALLDTLRRVRIGRAPPAGIGQQALTLAVLPDDRVAGRQCRESGERIGDD
ncbi:hypothetical protein [Luteimonas sp. R10]|uniref:hypothetical protein n=1 Tax=Luteimonas sp. R10 TaxID=3108176 RepID=UPI003091627B|nr:hypothetical protein U3649_14660 [Luteimonas sp. R10]